MMTHILYHVTPTQNVPSILEKGLEPRIGGRSMEIGEHVPAIYAFPTIDDMENALYNWLGDALEDEPCTCIEIRLPNTVKQQLFHEQPCGYEIICYDLIPPHDLHVTNNQL